MDYSLFKEIIDDAVNIGVKRIRLFLHGEPMLHPEIVEMIAYIKSKDLFVNITTNGMRLDHEKIEAILNTWMNF
jgi:MoaA/NifB/PqqE/SkfB family radical SAM enzyme